MFTSILLFLYFTSTKIILYIKLYPIYKIYLRHQLVKNVEPLLEFQRQIFRKYF